MPEPTKKNVGFAGTGKLVNEANEKTVFLSYCERNPDNEYLIEKILEPFLAMLGFEVYYYKKDANFEVPTKRMEYLIGMCGIVIGIYACDDKRDDGSFAPALNVATEMGIGRGKKELAIIEEKTYIGSMDFSTIPNFKFSREKYGKLLLDLLKILKNDKLLNIS